MIYIWCDSVQGAFNLSSSCSLILVGSLIFPIPNDIDIFCFLFHLFILAWTSFLLASWNHRHCEYTKWMDRHSEQVVVLNLTAAHNVPIPLFTMVQLNYPVAIFAFAARIRRSSYQRSPQRGRLSWRRFHRPTAYLLQYLSFITSTRNRRRRGSWRVA